MIKTEWDKSLQGLGSLPWQSKFSSNTWRIIEVPKKVLIPWRYRGTGQDRMRGIVSTIQTARVNNYQGGSGKRQLISNSLPALLRILALLLRFQHAPLEDFNGTGSGQRKSSRRAGEGLSWRRKLRQAEPVDIRDTREGPWAERGLRGHQVFRLG